MTNRAFWYELVTTDIKAAKRFYADVIGWEVRPFPGSEDYLVLHAGDRGVGGIMTMPDEMGAAMPPLWMGYVHPRDAEVSKAAIAGGGGTVHRAVSAIPNVGRFSVVADNQGAVFNLLQPDQPPMPADAIGGVGWRELYTGDVDDALHFYNRQFGWEESTTMDMGTMSAYQLSAIDGVDNGGMMKNPLPGAPNMWVFYFTIPALDAAIAATSAGGGKIMMGPIEVPGGSWVAMATEPQGAVFAITAQER